MIGEGETKVMQHLKKHDITDVQQQNKTKHLQGTEDRQLVALTEDRKAGAPENENGDGNGNKTNEESDNKSQSIVTSDMKKIIEENMAKVDQYGEDDIIKVRLLLLDVAGQSLFYDVHSILLRLQPVFVLVVTLDKDLADIAKTLFVDERKNIKKEIENYLVETNLDYTNRWMSALHHVSLLNEHTVEINFVPPPTILVLTKPDTVTGTPHEIESKIQKAKDTLLNSFTDYRCRSHIVDPTLTTPSAKIPSFKCFQKRFSKLQTRC